MDFNLGAANEKYQGSTKTYQKVGIYDDVAITSITSAINSNGNKYIQMETVGANGEVGRTAQMYLTEKAWPVTARNLVDLIAATNNVSEEEAKANASFSTVEQLTAKLSALLVGKKFRAKFKGEQTSKGAIIAQLGGSESMKVPMSDTKLYFNETRDIKMYQGTTTAEPTMKVAAPQDSLPF